MAYEDIFIRWTRGLTPEGMRISIFSHIRDIPYAIVPEWYSPDIDTVRMMITGNKGWCGPKHQLLFWMYQRLGLQIRFRSIPFRWQDQPVAYPDTIRRYISCLPSSRHLCCEVFLADAWKVVDATWDPPLRALGFPVNEPWDGVSETLPAVIALSEEKPSTGTGPAAQGYRYDFVHHLNRWLEEARENQAGPGYPDRMPKREGPKYCNDQGGV
jgi:hypothetical protein